MLAIAPGEGGGLLGNSWLEGALTCSPLLSEYGSESLAPCFSALFRFISLSSCLRCLSLRFLGFFPSWKAFSPSSSRRNMSSLLSLLRFLLTPHFLNLVWCSRRLQACQFLVMMSESQFRGLRCGLRPSIFRTLQWKECCSTIKSFTYSDFDPSLCRDRRWCPCADSRLLEMVLYELVIRSKIITTHFG